MYRTLNPDKIISTLEALEKRIAERFPDRNLRNVCGELVGIARESKAKAAAAARPNRLLRFSIALVLVLGLALLGYVASIIEVKRGAENLYGVLQGIEAAVNTLVLTGAGVFFLATLESRWKRQQAFMELHQLQSIVHVIDMHQLTKDPSRLLSGGAPTSSSPERPLTPFELTRYLDYCSEMLSLAAKIAALYAQATKDPVIIESTGGLEQLTANLSSKIWQKIRLTQDLVDAGAARARDASLTGASTMPNLMDLFFDFRWPHQPQIVVDRLAGAWARRVSPARG